MSFILVFMMLQQPIDVELLRAEKRLEKDSEDPKRNLELGMLLAMGRDRWNDAMPYLSKGSDGFLSTLADLEASGEDPMKIGYAWWNGSVSITKHFEGTLTGSTSSIKIKAKRMAAPFIPLMRRRGEEWFARAWPSLQEEDREKLRREVLQVLQNRRGRVTRLPAGWHTMPGENRPTKGCGIDTTWSRSFPSSFKAVGGSHLRLGEFKCEPGKEIRISARVRSEGTSAEPCEIRVRYFSKSGGITHAGPGIPNTPFWVPVNHTFESPDQTHHIDVVVFVGSEAGAVWVDDLSVTVDGIEIVRDKDFDGRADRR